MYNSTTEYEASILVKGRPIPEVQYQGRTYVEGRKDSQYSLQIRNNSSRRILAIPSVDGLNVLNGESCGIQSPGYVIDAHNSIEIPGWKVAGTQEAGRFVFKPQGASYEEDETYAESAGQDPTNQGAIGIMVFREKERVAFRTPCSYQPEPWRPHPFGPPTISSSTSVRRKGREKSVYSSNTTASSSGSICDSGYLGIAGHGDCEADDNGLGTGWGDAVDFHTYGVEFERADPARPDVSFVFLYDTIRNLRRIGVPVDQFYGRKSSPHEANPFPASPHVTGGCNPPTNWRGKRRKKGRDR